MSVIDINFEVLSGISVWHAPPLSPNIDTGLSQTNRRASVGTLEDVVDLLSWRRLELNTEPVIVYNPDGFWRPLLDLFQHTMAWLT